MMADTMEYIDDFFSGKLSPEEIVQFEQRLREDPVFAEEVAFYLNVIMVAKNEVAETKKERFKELYASQPKTDIQKAPRKIGWYAAAAAVLAGIIILSYFIFNSPAKPRELASTYIKEHFQTLGVTMSTSQDSLQKGLSLYNEGKAARALEFFEKIIIADSSSYLAKEYAGIVSLQLEQYDKALGYFLQLENYPGLYANPGKFYRSITLLKRNLSADEQKARELLQQVVNENLEGKETAKKWLKNF